MIDPSTPLKLLGLTKEEWELWGALGNRVSAAGSIGAVVVALWLANRAGRLKAKVSANIITILPAGSSTFHSAVVLSIVNTGERRITVSELGWREGFFRKTYYVQRTSAVDSSSLPCTVEHGETAAWRIPLQSIDDEPWQYRFAKHLLAENNKPKVRTIRAIFHTSIGISFAAKPAKGILRRINEGLGMARQNRED